MSKVLVYTIVAVVDDAVSDDWPTDVGLKDGWINQNDIIVSSVQQIDEDWLEMVKDRIDAD